MFGNNSSFRIGTDLIFCWDIKSCHWLTQRAVQEFGVKSSGKTNSRSSIIINFIFRIGWLGPNNQLNQKKNAVNHSIRCFRGTTLSQWVSYNTHIFGNLCQTLHNLSVRFVVVKHMKFVRNFIADSAEWFWKHAAKEVPCIHVHVTSSQCLQCIRKTRKNPKPIRFLIWQLNLSFLSVRKINSAGSKCHWVLILAHFIFFRFILFQMRWVSSSKRGSGWHQITQLQYMIFTAEPTDLFKTCFFR